MTRRAAARSLLVVVMLGPISVGAASVARAADVYGADVQIIDNAFDPQIVHVDPGQQVTWTNDGHSPHTVTADDGSFESGSIAPGGSFSHTFASAGAYRYYCRFHGTADAGMIGIVVVGDAPIPAASGISVGPGREQPPLKSGATITVPGDYPTIQSAVDHADIGGMVLVSPGTYKESVVVTTPFLTIRGTDRNRVILDGGGTLANGIHAIYADGVVVENMTAHHYVLNGFQWTDVHGFQGSYLTAWDNGDYGIYAFGSDYGRFDHVYASGSPDSGIYIGQCSPCHALVTDSHATRDALGFSGTNAGGDLVIVNSEWNDNLAGIVPNTLDSEALAPQRQIFIAGNYVHDNNSTTADTKDLEYPTFGTGILITGGQDDSVVGNLVEDQQTYGIAVMPNIDKNLWVSSGNVVRDNIVRRSGRADLALGMPSAGGDCFSGNDATTSAPPAIQLLYNCGSVSMAHYGGGDVAPTLGLGIRYLEAAGGTFPHGSWRTQPAPPAQTTMPKIQDAPVVPALAGVNVPGTYTIRNLSAIQPAAGPHVHKEVAVFGVTLATSWWGLLLGLYGYLMPFVLYAAWVSVAVWDLIRQDGAAISHRARWMAVVFLVPFAGPAIYFLWGHSPIPKQLRLMLVVGGMAAYLVIAVAAALLG